MACSILVLVDHSRRWAAPGYSSPTGLETGSPTVVGTPSPGGVATLAVGAVPAGVPPTGASRR